jgi:hypothetical protein
MSDETDQAGEALLAALATPARASSGAGSVDSRSIPDLIAAANYLNGLAAAQAGGTGLRFARLIPDGMIHRQRCAGGWHRW